MLWRALRDVGEGFYIDVGANDPVGDSVTLAFYERGWRGINVEPLSFHHEALCAQRPRDINLNCAIGASPGHMEFWEFEIHGWSTGDAEVAARHHAEGHRSTHRQVPVRTLAEVCAEHVAGPVHFLKIDVEGFEKDVLLGADFSRFRPWILVIEATAPNSMDDASAAWEELVLGQGYEYVYTDGINRFYLAREQAVLKPRFSHPPNVFDAYQRHAEAVYLEQLKHWKSKAEAQALALDALKARQDERPRGGRRRVFVDVSGHSAGQFFGGTSRVISQLLGHWLQCDDPDTELILVRCPRAGSDYERDTEFEQICRRRGLLQDAPLPAPQSGDVFLLAASHIFFTNSRHAYFDQLMAQGVKVCALVLDFLAVFWPQHAPVDWVEQTHVYARLLFRLDGVLCISRKVAQEFQRLVQANQVQLKPGFVLGWSHLGADFKAPGERLAGPDAMVLAQLADRPVFLAVSSIEPRKGYRQTLAAFELLWARGSDACLVILGKHLWLMDDFVSGLAQHPENGRRLFWFNGGSDALFDALLTRAGCLVMPSEDEGFGLPIVEAARHGLPLLLRDIPVFREIAGDHASYFAGQEAEDLATAVAKAQEAMQRGALPDPAAIRTLSWAEAADNFWRLLARVSG